MDFSSNSWPTATISAADFESTVLRSPQPVLVAFWAPWSHPCHILSAALAEVATACAGKVKVVNVNADDNPDLSIWYEIQSIPTLLYFINGSLRGRVVGTASKDAILAKLQLADTRGDSGSITRISPKEPRHP